MRDGLRDFLGGPAIDRALAILSLVGGTAVAATFGQIVDMAIEYPLPLGIVSGTLFLLGALLACLLGWRDARMERMRRQWAQEDQAREDEERRRLEDAKWAEHLRRRAFGLSWVDKLLLRKAVDAGEVELDLGTLSSDDDRDACLDRLRRMDDLVTRSQVGPLKWLVVPTDEGREVRRCYAELFDLLEEP